MDFQAIVDKVPDYQSFLTVDEMDESTRKLAAEYPNIVTVFEVGTSRNGHPIQCMKIGDGPKNALCFACPHPNEPIGAMTMEFFSRVLAEDERLREELGFTWYIIKCIDPDGVRLNESWFKGPYNIYTYTKHFFRPVGSEQVEWTFPIDYKELHFHEALPETKALMKIIDEIKPEFMYSLHNTGFGGAYWYISHDFPELYVHLTEAATKQGVALSLGEPEAPYVTEFAPAIFQTTGIRQYYEYTEQYTGKPPVIHLGASSGEYVSSKAECVTLVTELPYFFDQRVQDKSEGSISRKEAILSNVEMCNAHYALLESLLGEVRCYISADNPFVKLVDELLALQEESGESKRTWALSNPAFEETATVAQIFDNLYGAKFLNGLFLGLTVRTCEFELDRLQQEAQKDETAIRQLKSTYEKGTNLLKIYCEELEKELDYSVIPIQKLVRIQLECGLIVASHVGRKN